MQIKKWTPQIVYNVQIKREKWLTPQIVYLNPQIHAWAAPNFPALFRALNYQWRRQDFILGGQINNLLLI